MQQELPSTSGAGQPIPPGKISPGIDAVDPAAHYHEGVRAHTEQRYSDALAAFRRALALAPENPIYHAQLAVELTNCGYPREARDHYQNAVDLDPANRHIRAAFDSFMSRPFLTGLPALQGTATRQVYMAAIVDLLKDKPSPLRILEIGTYAGASLLTWWAAIERLYGGPAEILCVDPWDDTAIIHEQLIGKQDRVGDAYNAFLHNAALCPADVQVSHLRGTSADILPGLDGRTFDIIYVDGSHQRDDVLHDLRTSEAYLTDGGVFCGDDLELQLSECDSEFAQRHAADDYLEDPASNRMFHPGVTLAVDTHFGDVFCDAGFWAMRKVGDGYEKISLSDNTGIVPAHWPEEQQDQARQYFIGSGKLRNLLYAC